MGNVPDEMSYEQLKYVMAKMEECTEDYLFLVDFINNNYRISETALERFNLPAAQFKNFAEVLSHVINKEDKEMLMEELEQIKAGVKDFHDLEYRWKDKNNDDVWINCRGVAFNNENNTMRWMIGRITELGKDRKADNLTGFLMEPQLRRDLEKMEQHRQASKGYIIKIGINNFKEIKEIYGIEKGNKIIKDLACCIRRVLNKSTNIYRVGRKTFMFWLKNIRDIEEVEKTYRKLKEAVHDSIERNQYSMFYSISMGVAPIDFSSYVYEEIQKQAEFALNTARETDGRGFYIFDEQDYRAHIRKLDIQEKLRISVSHDYEGFEIYYQPLIRREDMELIGAEALLRFKCKEYGMISPIEFIPILEDSGLIIPVGRWVIQTAIAKCKEWQKYIKNFRISINLSYIQIKRSNVLEDILQALKVYKLAPEDVIIELTESGQLESNSLVLDVLESFRQKHLKVAIDDFGTGYSNLTYLKDFNANILKIDHTFTRKALNDSFDFRLVTHIVHMAHSIGLNVCMEGIETEEQKEQLDELKADYLQGYLFGKPMPAQEFEQYCL